MLSELFLAVCGSLAGGAALYTAITARKTRKALEEAQVDKTHAEEANLASTAAGLDERREADRERRYVEREQRFVAEIQGLHSEVSDLRFDIAGLQEFIVRDEEWHFEDDMERRAQGLPLRVRINFDRFMRERRAQAGITKSTWRLDEQNGKPRE